MGKGSCREDLVLLGANPTVTPPMWTTLATGEKNASGLTPRLIIICANGREKAAAIANGVIIKFNKIHNK